MLTIVLSLTLLAPTFPHQNVLVKYLNFHPGKSHEIPNEHLTQSTKFPEVRNGCASTQQTDVNQEQQLVKLTSSITKG